MFPYVHLILSAKGLHSYEDLSLPMQIFLWHLKRTKLSSSQESFDKKSKYVDHLEQ